MNYVLLVLIIYDRPKHLCHGFLNAQKIIVTEDRVLIKTVILYCFCVAARG